MSLKRRIERLEARWGREPPEPMILELPVFGPDDPYCIPGGERITTYPDGSTVILRQVLIEGSE